MNKAKQVKIMGEDFKVCAEVEVMQTMSAHADMNDLMRFLSCQDLTYVKKVFLVHGEYEVQLEFKKRLVARGLDVYIPAMGEGYDLDMGTKEAEVA